MVEHAAARMFKVHMTCRFGLVLKRFQVIFHQPAVFCTNDGRYLYGRFCRFCIFCRIRQRSLETPPPRHRGHYGASFSRNNTTGEMMGWPMAVGDAKLWKSMNVCIWHHILLAIFDWKSRYANVQNAYDLWRRSSSKSAPSHILPTRAFCKNNRR